MNRVKISRIAPDGSIVWTADGGRYLIEEKYYPLLARWRTGQFVQISTVNHYPEECELRLVERPMEFVVALPDKDGPN